MRRALVAAGTLVFVGIVLVAAIITRSEDAPSVPSMDDMKSGVGRVETLKCDGSPLTFGGRPASGSGFLIGDRVVMTAEHGMWVGLDEPACKTRVRFGQETYEVVEARLWSDRAGTDMLERRGIDLATLTLARPVEGHIFSFAPRGEPVGGRIATIGYPMGGPLKVTRGVITKNVIDYEVPSIAAKIDIEGGNSGGPIVNDRGEVVSVVSRIVISGSLTADKSNRWGGVDVPRWWNGTLTTDLCHAHSGLGIPGCANASEISPTKVSIPLPSG